MRNLSIALTALLVSAALTRSVLKPPNDDEAETGKQLLVEEYKSCRDLLGRNIEIIERSEVYAVGAVAATCGFSLAASDPFVTKLSCWIPLAISLLGMLRFWGVDNTIDIINNRLVMIERRYPKHIRWTRFYRRENRLKGKRLKTSRYTLWWLLIAISVAFGAIITCHGPAKGSKPTLDLTIHSPNSS